MKLQEEDLKKIFQLSRGDSAAEKQECPSFDLLMKLFSSEISEKDKFKIIDHMTGCSSCYWKFEAIRDVLKGTKEISREWKGVSLSKEDVMRLKEMARARVHELEKSRCQKQHPGRKTNFQALFLHKAIRYVPVAAGILAIILTALFVFQNHLFLKKDTVRGKGDQGIQLISPKGEVRDFPIVFKWHPYSGAMGYEVKLLDEELTNIWASEKTEETEVELPQDQSQRLEKEKTYYWKVIAHLAARKTKESNLLEFKFR